MCTLTMTHQTVLNIRYPNFVFSSQAARRGGGFGQYLCLQHKHTIVVSNIFDSVPSQSHQKLVRLLEIPVTRSLTQPHPTWEVVTFKKNLQSINCGFKYQEALRCWKELCTNKVLQAYISVEIWQHVLMSFFVSLSKFEIFYISAFSIRPKSFSTK